MSSGKKNTLSAPPTPSGAIPIVAPPATRTAASSSTMGTPDRPSRIAMSQSAHNLSLDAADYSPVNRHPHSTNASSASGPNSSNTHGPELSSGSGRRPQTTTQVHIDPSFEASELLGLDMSGIRLRSLPLGLFHSSLEGLYELHLNGNFLTKLPPQIGLLRQLIFLDLSENALQTVPKELGRLVNLQELLLHNNQLASLPAELGYLYQLESFSLDNNPLQEPLLSLVHSQGALSVITYLREHVLSINPPPDRIWHSLMDIPQVPSNNTFTLMSYNILAEKYATTQMYGYVASWYLSWDVRKQMILHEILAYDPDIVCLQEVEAGQFESYFKPQLRMRGNYDGLYAPKSRARTMNEWDRTFVDGCATFFKMDRFRLVEQHLIEFNQLALSRPLLRKHKDMYNRVMTRDNIALVARLQMLLGPASWTELLVTNVHVHWDPTFKDVKLVQTIMLCEELEKIVANVQAGLGRLSLGVVGKTKRIGVIIAGDFNSLPDSGVSKFLGHGGIGPRHGDFMAHTYEPYSTEGARHALSLRSAYDHVALKVGPLLANPEDSEAFAADPSDEPSSSIIVEEGGGEEEGTRPQRNALLPFTNLTPAFQGTIDYIYYGTEGPLVVTGALVGLDRDYSRQLVGLPSPHFPSDHISLLVEFKVDEQSAREILSPIAPSTGVPQSPSPATASSAMTGTTMGTTNANSMAVGANSGNARKPPSNKQRT